MNDFNGGKVSEDRGGDGNIEDGDCVDFGGDNEDSESDFDGGGGEDGEYENSDFEGCVITLILCW